jgi:replicative DNA helicase
MDKIMLPAGPGEMIVMAARPGVGKSAMAENVADHWAGLNRGPILFVSVEMRKDQILDRTLSRYTGIEARKLILGELTEDEMSLVREKAALLKDRPVIFLADGFTTSLDVRSAAAKARMLYGNLGGIVVDYMQKLMDDGEQETQRVTRISRNLKAIAVENNCPLIALSQLSRRIEQEGDREPELSDLRESGAIEQDADAVVFMLRKGEARAMRVFVKKQRQGQLGKFTVLFDGDHSTFDFMPSFGFGDEVVAAPAAEADALTW